MATTPIPTTITLGADRLEIVQDVLDPDRQPILITLGRDQDGAMDLTLNATAPESRDSLVYLGNLLSSLGRELAAATDRLAEEGGL